MISLAVVVGVASAARANAQTVASAFSELEQQVNTNQHIYIYPARGHRIRARLLNVSATVLQVVIDGQPREFSERDISMITEPHKNIAKGALVGLLVGTALDLSALHGWQLIRDCPHDPESCSWAKLGLVVVGGGGALMGAGIGHSIEREQTLFFRPQTKAVSVRPIVDAHRRELAMTLRF